MYSCVCFELGALFQTEKKEVTYRLESRMTMREEKAGRKTNEFQAETTERERER